MSAPAFATEATLHAAVSSFFTRLGIPHSNQHAVGAGAADVMLSLPTGRPWALIELKNGLERMDLGDAAEYFEQALKYRLESGLPVFLGPFFHGSFGTVSQLLSGRQTALSALACLGGRADVGLFFVHAVRSLLGNPVGWYGFQLVLRQQRVACWVQCEGDELAVWPAAPLRLVDLESAGSRKDRTA